VLDFTEKNAKSGNGSRLVVFLHGWGSDKYDLMSISDDFSKVSEDIIYIFANAPFDCECGQGYQWFSLKNMDLPHLMDEVKNNYTVLETFIEKQSQRLGLGYENIFLVGFSQGAILSLYTGMRLDKKLGGIIAFSGLLAETEKSLKTELKTKQKILMTHGMMDTVIPFQHFLHSKKLLETFGFEFNFYADPNLEHGVNTKCIEEAKRFLTKVNSMHK
jgi:phospholipase/carboxylesterase